MAPFRNFLTKKAALSNGGDVDNGSNNRLSTENQRSNPLSTMRNSCENSPNEYKLSGTLSVHQLPAVTPVLGN